MRIKPNYVNPCPIEVSFHEILPDLDDLGIDREKFLSMFRSFTQYVATQTDNLNLFEMHKLVHSQKRVRVVKNAVRNRYTKEQWYKHVSLKIPYLESFDAVIIPLKTNKFATSARLAICPEINRMELQVKLFTDHSEWICIETDQHRFVSHFRHIVLNM